MRKQKCSLGRLAKNNCNSQLLIKNLTVKEKLLMLNFLGRLKRKGLLTIVSDCITKADGIHLEIKCRR